MLGIVNDDVKKQNDDLQLKLRVDELFLKYAFNSINAGLWEYLPEEKLLRQRKKLDGRFSEDNLDVPNYRESMKGWGLIHPDDMVIFDSYCDSMDNGDAEFTYDLRMLTDNYTYRWIRYIGNTIYNDDGSVALVVGETLDITDEKEEADSIIKQAREDSLTHVYTKEYLRILVNEIIKTEGMNAEHQLLIVDIDDFKQVNRKYGRLYGDNVLETVAGALQTNVGSKDIVGRIGSDEFVVFCPNTSRDEREAIANTIIGTIRTIKFKNDTVITASIGTSSSPIHGKDFDSLYKAADVALYQAKLMGKDCFSVYSRENSFSGSVGETARKSELVGDDEYNFASETLSGIEKPIFDYCFNIVTRVEDFDTALDEIFDETGKYFELDRISLTEKNTMGELAIYYNWYRDQNHSPKHFADILSGQAHHFDTLQRRFENNEYFIYRYGDPTDEITSIPKFAEKENRTFIQFPIIEDEVLIGTVTFEDSTNVRNWSDNEIATLSSISKMVINIGIRHRNKLRLANETLYTGRALENEHLTYYVVDPKSYELKYISTYANEIFPNLKVGEKCYEAAMGLKDPCDFCPNKHFEKDTRSFSFERYDKNRDTWFSITASELITSDTDLQSLVCWTDVTAFLERVSATDRLTGVLSYEKFKTDGTVSLHDKQSDLIVAFAGIRHFNFINDQLGYEIGDEVLKIFASCFSEALSPDEKICRIKGDDFVLMLDDDKLIGVADRIKNIIINVEKATRQKFPQISLVANFGTYRVKSDDYAISRCIDKANRAKKAAEAVSGAEICMIYDFDDNLGAEESEAARLESMMYDALNTNQFHVYVQPKIDIKTGQIGGAEALIRWILPDGTFIPTFKFIPLFEKNGFIVEIDKFVYRTLFSYIRKWLDEGKEPTLISVNVSRLHLFDDSFPDYLNSLAHEYNIPHRYVEVEITESVFFDNTERLIKIITELRNKGFVISMDDFGTGYSTLNLMKSLPIDIVKIDSGFFLNNEMDSKSKAVISSIIHLCKNLDLRIVCEGIETGEQVEYIKLQDCDYAQGFYYYKPMPIEEFEKLV
jgi:diguanylate cyclase (GGDEF)-like protein